MNEYSPSMARQGIRLILEHFGTKSDYLTVQSLYIDLCDLIAERAVDPGHVDVNAVIVRAFEKAWEELHPRLPFDVDNP